jgi:Tfp pilus assembly protein PilO
MPQDFVNIIIVVAGAAMGWMLKVVWESIKELQQDTQRLEREVHTRYVSKDDYRTDIQELKDMLKAIFERLDRKADK